MDLKPAATDAFAYIAAVKDQLQGEPDKYQELINTLIEFQGNRLGMVVRCCVIRARNGTPVPVVKLC